MNHRRKCERDKMMNLRMNRRLEVSLLQISQPHRGRGVQLLLALALGAGLIGCDRLGRQPMSGEGAATAVKQVPVVTVESRLVREILHLPTTIIGYEQAELLPKVDAYVEQVHVNIGDEVKRNDLLVTLQSPELSQQVEQQAKLLAEASADIDLAEAEWNSAKAKLSEQQAMIDLRESELARMTSLVASGAMTDRKREEAEYAMKSAQATMEQTLNAVKVAQARQNMAQAHADVVASQLAQAETMASYLLIRAPFAGVITKRNVDTGTFVRPATGSNASPLIEMAVVDTVRAIVHVTMGDVNKIATGKPVTITLTDVPGETFPGSLTRISGVFDKNSRMMRAEIDLPNKPNPKTGQRLLRPGSYGSAAVVVREETLPVVPKKAIQEVGDKKTVMVVSSDGTCLTTSVEIRVNGGELLGIGSGLAAGDRVVANTPGQVKNGQKLSTAEIKSETY